MHEKIDQPFRSALRDKLETIPKLFIIYLCVVLAFVYESTSVTAHTLGDQSLETKLLNNIESNDLAQNGIQRMKIQHEAMILQRCNLSRR